MSIPILNKPELLQKLKGLVTLEPAGDVKQATGVPRHVKVMDELREVYRSLNGYVEEVQELKAKLSDMVKTAMEEKAAEGGHVTSRFVVETVTEAINKSTEAMESTITTAVNNATKHLRTVHPHLQLVIRHVFRSHGQRE